jgi:ABC-type lipoprotein release transport system permease subunit
MYLTLAWRNIWRNKRRSIISILSVVFAVLVAMVMRSMQLGFYARSIDNIVSYYTGYLQVHDPGYQDKGSLDYSFDRADSVAKIVSAVRHVTVTTPRLESFALVSAGEVTDGARIVGIDPAGEDRLTGLKKKLTAGRYLASRDEGILLAGGLAGDLGMSVGDTVVVLGSGYHGVQAAGRYRVTGIVTFPSPELNSGMAYLALPEAQRLFGAEGRVTSLAVMIAGQRYLRQVETALKGKLGDGYEIIPWETMLPGMVQYIQLDNAGGILMLLLVYVVVGFGILGTVLMMTMERTREFGVLIAVGMGRKVLGLVVLLESVLLSLNGAVAGMLLSVPVLIYLRAHPIHLTGAAAEGMRSYGFEPIFPFSMAPSIFFWQTVTVLAIAVAAAAYPLFRIAKLRVVDAMRSR